MVLYTNYSTSNDKDIKQLKDTTSSIASDAYVEPSSDGFKKLDVSDSKSDSNTTTVRSGTEHAKLEGSAANLSVDITLECTPNSKPNDDTNKKLERTQKSKFQSLNCFELLKWWVGENTSAPLPKADIAPSAMPPQSTNEDRSRWLGKYTDDWTTAQADRFAASGADLQALANNIDSLAAMSQRGDGVEELGSFCCGAAARVLDRMASTALLPGPPASHDISLLLPLLHACADLAVRVDEFRRRDEAEALVDLCQARAVELFRLRLLAAQAAADADSHAGALVAVCADAASLRLLRGRATDAGAALEPALPLVRDDLDEAAEFHLIRASVLEAQVRFVRTGRDAMVVGTNVVGCGSAVIGGVRGHSGNVPRGKAR